MVRSSGSQASRGFSFTYREVRYNEARFCYCCTEEMLVNLKYDQIEIIFQSFRKINGRKNAF